MEMLLPGNPPWTGDAGLGEVSPPTRTVDPAKAVKDIK